MIDTESRLQIAWQGLQCCGCSSSLYNSAHVAWRRSSRPGIPSLIVAPSGTVLAICEGRKDGGGLTGIIDIVMRRSHDGGKSWSPLEVVADDGANTLGNPCALLDQSTKTVWLAFTRSLGQDTEEQIVAGTSRERTRVLAKRGATQKPSTTPIVRPA